MSHLWRQGVSVKKKYSFASPKKVVAWAVASGLALASLGAEAAGLGRITVYSALGQPLRAEVQVSATRDELAGMTARLAPPEAFRQAGVDYAYVLGQLRFALEKRADGAVIKVSSDRPVNDPFLDFLLELNWSSGRLVREYTFLLDPPEVAAQVGRRQAVVESRSVPALAAGGEQGESLAPRSAENPAADKKAAKNAEPAAADSSPGGKKAQKGARKAAEKPAAQAEPAKPAGKSAGEGEAAGTHVVKPGETLRRIASDNLPDGVSLEQMLLALYRNNADAFEGKNMNRLKSGAVLQIPAPAEAAAVPAEEARRVFRAQAADWNAYRHKLAGAAAAMPAGEASGSRAASGQVGARVEEKVAPAESARDQVRVSRTHRGAPGGATSEEDRVAREKALRESQERVAALEKNVAELQKLLEMKNRALAELQKQATATPPASPGKAAEKPDAGAAVSPATSAPPTAQAAKPAVAEKPAETGAAPEAAKPVEAAKPETPAAAPDKPIESADASKPAEAEKPAEAANLPPPPKPVAKPVTPPPPPPAPEEPGFFDDLGLLPLAGGGGLVALLAGYLIYRRRKAADETALDESVKSGEAVSEAGRPSTLGPNSVFQSAGGQSVDTSNTTPPTTTDFSQAGPGAIDTDEVDPVAEADVYMAYGRDAQAEEILLDALQKDPQRTAIHSKLLEIYASRKSAKQFETLASELYAQTGGKGAEWEKVAAMGRSLDPGNPLYMGAGAAGMSAAAAPSTARPEARPEARPVPQMASRPEAVTPPAAPPAAPPEHYTPPARPADSAARAAEMPAMDFAATRPLVDEALKALPEEGPAALPGVLDFDLGTPAPAAPSPAAVETGAATQPLADAAATVVQADDAGLDFNLEAPDVQNPKFTPGGTLVDGSLARSAAPTQEKNPAPTARADTGIDFELSVPELSAPANVTPAPAAAGKAPAGDLAATQVMQEGSAMAALEPDEDMEFDVHLTDSTVLGGPAGGGFDLSGIDLDLGGAPAPAAEAAPAQTPAPGDALREEVNTKLDLAKAYEDMGDLEGARELLGEVLKEGAPDQVAAAQTALARMGG
jgi:pilus assembly protein FimV